MKITEAQIKRTFAALEHAAVNGMRCPKNCTMEVPDGELHAPSVRILRRRGDIRIEVFPENFRRITILSGPNAGKATAAPANKTWQPYKILDQHGELRGPGARHPERAQPSAPRPLDPNWHTKQP